MALKTSGSEPKPVTWLIITGFVVASLSVLIMAYLAYTQLLELREMSQRSGQPERFINLMDAVLDDFDQASILIRQQAIAPKSPLEDRVDLDYRLNRWRVKVDSMESLALNLGCVPQTKRLGASLEERYRILDKLENEYRQPAANRPSQDSIFLNKPKIEPYYLENMLHLVRGDSSAPKEKEDFFLRDSIFQTTLFPYLYEFTAKRIQNEKFLFGLLEEEEKTILVQNLIQAQLVSELRSIARERYKEVGENASRANQFIGFSTVMILLLCILFLAKIISDVEKNRRLQAQLSEEKSRAEALAKAKEEFLANMSHEMRTPMNAVIGFSDQLAETSLAQEQQQLLRPIRHSADLLLELINDILDFTKLESGNFTLSKAPFDLKKVLQEVREIFTLPARNKGIAFSLEVDQGLPSFVLGDKMRLKQMLLNLCGNAVKFTDEGGVKLKVRRESKEDSTVMLRFDVIDSGIGIPEEEQNRIFEDFIQVEKGSARRFGGTGLGLSITRKLALLHGGEVALFSKVGKGTRVSLLLPYQLSSKEEMLVEGGESEPRQVHPDLKGVKVLLADDDAYNRLLVKGHLERWQMEVVVVNNGKEVVEALEASSDFALLIIDLQMPELDGIQATEILRGRLGMSLPILALTATSSAVEKEKAMKAGVQALMLKPFKGASLHKTLVGLLDLDWDRVEEVEVESSSKYHSPNEPFPELYKATRGDLSMMKKMLGQYLTLSKSNEEKLLQAYKEKKGDDLALLAHRMIPAHRHLGFGEVVAQLKQIERLGEAQIFNPELEGLMEEILDRLLECRKQVVEVLSQGLERP